MSRKLTAALFSSVDGVVSSPNLFQFDSFDEDMGTLMGQAISTIDDVILGRVSYLEWADYWPNQANVDPFAAFINPVTKHVASRTLAQTDLEWENSRLIDGELNGFVRGLKETEGRDIAIQGSISVVRQLFLDGLLDTLTLMIHPVIAGTGIHLFGPEDPMTRLELVDHVSTSNGNALLTYSLRS